MIVARRYVIAGRVQGVGFRLVRARRRRARRECTAGCATWPTAASRSSPKGRRRRSIALEAAVRRGPSSARVERFDVEDDRADRAHDRIRDHDRAHRSMDTLKTPHPPRAGLPEARHPLLRRHDAAARPGGVQARDRQHGGAVSRPGHLARRRHREPRLHPRRGGRRSDRRRLRAGAQGRQAAVTRRFASATISSTAPTASRCTATRSSKGSGC